MLFEAKEFRRVVTGHDANGVATVISDETASSILQRPTRPGVTLTNFWQNEKTPAQMERHDDPVAGPLILHPPQNGSVFRVVQFNPEDPDVIANIDGEAAFSAMGAGANVVEGGRHPYMHRTDSLDYSIVLSGEVYMMMDEEDYLLKTGDVVVQQGTNHAWSNRGTEPCIMLFVLVHAVNELARYSGLKYPALKFSEIIGGGRGFASSSPFSRKIYLSVVSFFAHFWMKNL